MVVDCSCIIAWLLREQLTAQMQAFHNRLVVEGADAPALFLFEVANAFLVAIRRKRIAAPQALQLIAYLEAQEIQLDHVSTGTPEADAAFRLALGHQLSAYDAAYLELALRLGAELATLDKELAAAARAEGVALVDLGLPA